MEAKAPNAESGVAGWPLGGALARSRAPAAVLATTFTLIFAVVGMFVILVWQGIATTRNDGEQQALKGAGVVAANAGWALGGYDALLKALSARIGGDPAALTADIVQGFYEDRSGLPGSVSLKAYDAEGRGLALPGDAAPVGPIEDSGTFAALKDGAGWAVSRQLDMPGASGPGFLLLRRLEGSDRQFRGALAVFFDGGLIELFRTPLELGEAAATALLRTDGWLVSRVPPVPETRDFSGPGPFEQVVSAQRGSYSAVSSIDGLDRMIGFEAIPQFGLIAVVALSSDAVFSKLWDAVWIVSWLIGPIAIALGIGAVMIARLLARLGNEKASLRTALDRNELLFREVHHRVKNNLQSVTSLLHLQPIAPEVKAEMAQRINAMAMVHEQMYRANRYDAVDLQDYLSGLVETLAAGHASTVKVTVDLQRLSVPRDLATPLGLIVNEVLTNAFKHAFPDNREGTISVALKRVGGSAELTVHDDGVGYDPAAPGKGIGRRLIDALTRQVGGTSAFDSTAGGRFVLTFPLEAEA